MAFDDWLADLEERATVIIDTALLRQEARERMRDDTDTYEEAAGETTGVAAP
jgi:hypothetical protein